MAICRRLNFFIILSYYFTFVNNDFKEVFPFCVKNQKLYNIIETLPENISDKVLEYIYFLKWTEMTNTPIEELTIKGKNDLRNKLQEGEEDVKKGRVISLDEAFDKIEGMLAE